LTSLESYPRNSSLKVRVIIIFTAMAKSKKKKEKIIEGLEIIDFASEGKCIGKHDGKVIFVPFTAPGDVVDVRVLKDRRNHADATAVQFQKRSSLRTDPVCQHFQICGGCKWQHVPYNEQLKFKESQAKEQLLRIGKLDIGEWLPIVGCIDPYEYRNKMEFTFSHKRWMTMEEIQSGEIITDPEALGFHIPGKFDKILDIRECHLMDKRHNEIRNEIKRYALEKGISFFNVYEFSGSLRNVMIRLTSKDQWMVLMIFGEPLNDLLKGLMDHLAEKFTFINSLLYVINQKKNDTYGDLKIETYKGYDHIMEDFQDLQFKISPKSFFQTNSNQALRLYQITKEFAHLKGDELVYDLYTGTGSIACFVADKAKKVVGVEYVEDAIRDAKINAELNGITNADFYAGDMKDVLNDAFITQHGKPDVIITDPPRAGMHEDVAKKILEISPERIVYVSCNPATQARDLSILAEKYAILKSQPVDMFPHTHHVENVVLLELKN
jgi:23S rRNA (uracil1939-C5)-methyltransferase